MATCGSAVGTKSMILVSANHSFLLLLCSQASYTGICALTAHQSAGSRARSAASRGAQLQQTCICASQQEERKWKLKVQTTLTTPTSVSQSANTGVRHGILRHMLDKLREEVAQIRRGMLSV